jgi:hypothetical protein
MPCKLLRRSGCSVLFLLGFVVLVGSSDASMKDLRPKSIRQGQGTIPPKIAAALPASSEASVQVARAEKEFALYYLQKGHRDTWLLYHVGSYDSCREVSQSLAQVGYRTSIVPH